MPLMLIVLSIFRRTSFLLEFGFGFYYVPPPAQANPDEEEEMFPFGIVISVVINIPVTAK